VEYKKNADSTWSIPVGSPVTGTTLNLNGLSDGTDYTFRVRELCIDNQFSNWIYSQFTTGVPSCLPPTSITTSNISEETANVSWTGSVSASNGYVVQWREIDVATWNSSLTTTFTQYIITGLTAGTQYQVRVISLCAAGGQATSPAVSFTTDPDYTQCQLITTTGISITGNDTTQQYTATFSNTGGTPSTENAEYSIDGGVTFASVATIINITPTSITYVLPVGAGVYPKTHVLKLTPKCPDNSTGTGGVGTYTAPPVFAQFVTYQNALDDGGIAAITIDNGGNILTTNLVEGQSKNWNQTSLLGAAHSAVFTFNADLPIGTAILISHVRGSSTLASGNLIYTGGTSTYNSGFVYQNGDIIKVSTYQVQTINSTVTLNCNTGHCFPSGSSFPLPGHGGYLTFNFGAPTPAAITYRLGWCSISESSGFLSLCFGGVSNMGFTPVASECNTSLGACFDTLRYTFTVPAGVTTYTTPILYADDPSGQQGGSYDNYGVICSTCQYANGSTVSPSEKVKHLYLKPTSSNYVINFTLTNPDITLHT
jgi:hypothetical protein